MKLIQWRSAVFMVSKLLRIISIANPLSCFSVPKIRSSWCHIFQFNVVFCKTRMKWLSSIWWKQEERSLPCSGVCNMVMNFFFYTVLINSTSLPVRIHTRKLQDSWEGERQNSSLPTPFFFYYSRIHITKFTTFSISKCWVLSSKCNDIKYIHNVVEPSPSSTSFYLVKLITMSMKN